MEHFGDNESTHQADESLVKSKSNFTPRAGSNSSVDEAASRLRSLNLVRSPKASSNLSKTERRAIERLQNNSNFIIKLSDKSSSTVIMDRDHCTQMCENILDDTDSYEAIDRNQDNEVITKV